MSRLLIIIGIILVLIGLAWPLIKKLGIGNLPGDIIIRKENFSFYFPIMTCVILSVVISLIFWLMNR